MGDLSGWRHPPMEQQRLAATVTGLFTGAIIGALLVVHAHAWAALFPLAMRALVVAAATVAFPAGGGARRASASDRPLGQELADGRRGSLPATQR